MCAKIHKGLIPRVCVVRAGRGSLAEIVPTPFWSFSSWQVCFRVVRRDLASDFSCDNIDSPLELVSRCQCMWECGYAIPQTLRHIFVQLVCLLPVEIVYYLYLLVNLHLFQITTTFRLCDLPCRCTVMALVGYIRGIYITHWIIVSSPLAKQSSSDVTDTSLGVNSTPLGVFSEMQVLFH